MNENLDNLDSLTVQPMAVSASYMIFKSIFIAISQRIWIFSMQFAMYFDRDWAL